jgi:hypothetical protein
MGRLVSSRNNRSKYNNWGEVKLITGAAHSVLLIVKGLPAREAKFRN